MTFFRRLSRLYTSQDPVVFYSLFSAFFLIVVQISTFATVYNQLPSQIPLFYSLPWGQPQLASLAQLLILPFLSILFILLNTIFSWHLHQAQIALKRLFALSTLGVVIILSITTLKIIFIFI